MLGAAYATQTFMTRAAFACALFLTFTACYTLAEQEQDVRAGIYREGRTGQDAIRTVYGPPDRIEIEPNPIPIYEDELQPAGYIQTQTWYYNDLGKWFRFEDKILLAWGPIRSPDFGR